ncbi:CaiB/BaiF CoA transferase family protein [Phytohabitans suffuscus]|uniref:CoA transferase n=1 Tax=Phytohabitans suffuscus TaxID=624315 RepID=A0A6F8YCM6_9ACTN|nr:CaiB/BaiF CoA-transferase family protein [Phytohabitans suffuscus]BCB83783.1 CoA transferase [Phytohabitans suffuscus]
MAGHLAGVRVVEFLGLGPAPFGCLVLADLGADVLTITKPGQSTKAMVRNRSLLELDLKNPDDAAVALSAIDRADVVVESFRPGVMERLGIDPERLRQRNSGLIVARMTGWGQSGPLAPRAGHDINYIAITGALDVARRPGAAPMPTANLVGDFAGGGMYLVIAVLAALVERSRTGVGAVIDVAIVDGTAYLTTMLHEYRGLGMWSDTPGTNRLDTGAPYYDSYETADGGWVAVGALEEKFFQRLADLVGLTAEERVGREDAANWPRLRERIAASIRSRTRAEWAEIAERVDACIAPVLSLAEAGTYPHLAARGVLRRTGTDSWVPVLPLGHVDAPPGADEVLRRWGVALPRPAAGSALAERAAS